MLQRTKTVVTKIIYLPELIGFSFGAVLSVLSLFASKALFLTPSILRNTSKFFIRTFLSLIAAIGIFATLNFLLGVATILPVTLLSAVLTGAAYLLPLQLRLGFGVIFAATLANFKWRVSAEESFAGYQHFWQAAVSATLLVCMRPSLPLIFIWNLGPSILIGLGILEPEKLATSDLATGRAHNPFLNQRDRRRFLNNIEHGLQNVWQQLLTGGRFGVSITTTLKEAIYINTMPIIQTVAHVLSSIRETFVIAPYVWLKNKFNHQTARTLHQQDSATQELAQDARLHSSAEEEENASTSRAFTPHLIAQRTSSADKPSVDTPGYTPPAAGPGISPQF